METLWMTTSDGGRLRYGHWPLAGGAPALILTGRAEPADKYAEVAEELRARGFTVWALNWRGQGGSSRTARLPRRGHIRTFDLYLRDLSTFIAHLAANDPAFQRRRLTLFAHSMGAHLALRAAHDDPERFAALILSAPMISVALPVPLAAVRVLTGALVAVGLGERVLPVAQTDTASDTASDTVSHSIATAAGSGATAPERLRFEGNVLTGDRVRFDRYQALLDARPDLITGPATIAWLRAALASIAVVQAAGYAASIPTPTLLLAPALDAVVPPRAMRAFAAAMPAALFVRLPGGRHELFQESDDVRRALWRQVDAFLAGHG